MHIAVKGEDLFESCRPVRALLIKGADINVKDNYGNLPFDYIREVDSDAYANELKNLLKVNQSNCHAILGTTPVQKVKKNRTTMIAFYVFYFIVIAFKALLIYPR